MRTSRQASIICAAALFAGIGLTSPITAGDRERYASPSEAYRQGLTAWQQGNTGVALEALDHAASKGVLDAQLRLAEIYAVGNGVKQDRAKSYGYYQQIVGKFAGASPRHPVAGQIAKAFVALGGYYRDGIAELNIKPDAAYAASLYRHAASYFGHVEAQYNLARMYLEGIGVNKNVRLAVNWLTNATRKKHAPSQALLGNLLWNGYGAIYHDPLKGLALIELARRNSVGTADEAWIEELFVRVSGEAKDDERERAEELALQWQGDSGNGNVAKSAPAAMVVNQPAPQKDAADSLAAAQKPAAVVIHKIETLDKPKKAKVRTRR